MAQINTKQTKLNAGPRNEHNVESNGEFDETNESNDDKYQPKQTMTPSNVENNKNSNHIPKKEKTTIVYNYSSIHLDNHMNKLLNRGLNFAVLPLKLDLTEVLVDFKRFERSTN